MIQSRFSPNKCYKNLEKDTQHFKNSRISIHLKKKEKDNIKKATGRGLNLPERSKPISLFLTMGKVFKRLLAERLLSIKKYS